MDKKLHLHVPDSKTRTTDYLIFHLEPEESASVGGPLDPIGIELDIPAAHLSSALQRGVQQDLKGAGDPQVPGLVSFEGADGHWVISAMETGNSDAVCLFLTNAQDADGGGLAPEKWGVLNPGKPLVVKLPLTPPTTTTQVHVIYRYATAFARRNLFNPTTDGHFNVWLLPGGNQEPDVQPVVALKADQESPTALDMGREVKISWIVEQGVSAKLLGPLPTGTNVLSLDEASDFPISQGHIWVRALGVQTYLLQATVRGGKGQPNIQVVRTLMLDVFSAKVLSILKPLPRSVLPFGSVEAHWAAWGVKGAEIKAKDFSGQVVMENRGHIQEGQGVFSFRAGAKEDIPVRLILTKADQSLSENTETVYVVNWQHTSETIAAHRPMIALTYAGNKHAGRLLICRRNQLFSADVGGVDRDVNYEPRFDVFSPQNPLTALAVASLEDHFYVFGLAKGDGAVAVMRFDLDGQRSKAFSYTRVLSSYKTSVFQMIAIGTRMFITETVAAGKPGENRAISMETDHDGESFEYADEFGLARFSHWQLVGLRDRIYAFHPDEGQLICFQPGRFEDIGGMLGPPRVATAPPHTPSKFDLTKGVLVAVDPVLVLFGVGKGPHPQDLVYNPQTDRWSVCGHGLRLDQSKFAFRNNPLSQRLWATTGDTIKTLYMGTSNLFSRYFVEGTPLKPLTQNYFDKVISLWLYNSSPLPVQIENFNGCKAVLQPGEHASFTRVLGIANATSSNFALRYRAADGNTDPGTWIVHQGSEKKHFFPNNHDWSAKPKRVNGLIAASAPQKFSGPAKLGSFDTGIVANPDTDNYLILIGGIPQIDRPGIMRKTANGKKRHKITWSTKNASGTILSLIPEITGTNPAEPKEIDLYFYHRLQQNPGHHHHLILRWYAKEPPVADDHAYTVTISWQKKQDPQTKRVFFEADFPELIGSKGSPAFFFPTLQVTYDQLLVTFTPFRVFEEQTLVGETAKLSQPEPT